MLHDSLTIQEVVDSDCAHEFLKEATKLASSEELQDIGARLAEKERVFRKLLSPEALDGLGKEELKAVLGLIFRFRRKSGFLLRENGLERIREETRALLYGQAPLASRFDRFAGAIHTPAGSQVSSLASELLHYSQPDRYWLWTSWIWDPKTGAGALSLVTSDKVDLSGGSDGQIYENVGRVTAMVDAAGHGEGYSSAGRGLAGTNVFLACVYTVYMYAVFKMKLSQEFNRILPELPELARRLLGVHRIEEVQ